MELREWLIILGLALVTIIVIDGVRRLQRQRRVPRLDRVDSRSSGTGRVDMDLDDAAKEAEINWELPNGGARVVRPAAYDQAATKPKLKPKLERQEHPGPSRVLSEWRKQAGDNIGNATRGEASTDSSSLAASSVDAVRPVDERVETQASNGTSDMAPVEKPSSKSMPDTRPASDETPVSQSENVAQKAKVVEPSPEAGSYPENVDVGANDNVIDDVVEEAEVEKVALAGKGADVVESIADDDMVAPDKRGGDELRTEPTLSALDDEASFERNDKPEPLMAEPEDHDEHPDAERYRLVDIDGMTDSLRHRSARVGASMQRFGVSVQKSLAERKERRKKEKLEKARLKAEKQAREASQRKQAEAEKAARLAAEREQEAARQAALREQQGIDDQDQDDPLFAPSRLQYVDSRYTDSHHADGQHGVEPVEYRPSVSGNKPKWAAERVVDTSDATFASVRQAERSEDVVTSHPVVEKALRHDVNVEHARETLSHAEEVIVISVISRDEQGFSGAALLDLMLACGLRYSSDMGIFNRFETEDTDSELQFSMVNVVKPGTFPLESMDEFRTPGITLLMPLPGALDTAAAFEAMVETAMVVVRHLGGELKDENQSVMTAQTVEFARQRVQEFERRHRLHRYQAN